MHSVVAESLAKSYGRNVVLRKLALNVSAGETVVIAGGNGAGKTTLLRVLATLTRADSGAVQVNGYDVARAAEEVRRTIGVVTHSPMLYGDLTARENLLFHARMFRSPSPALRVEEVAARMKIAARLGDRVRDLSHGFQKRVALARALLHRPQLLVLDEPESGLDQEALDMFERVLAEHRRQGGAAVIATHLLGRAVRYCDRVAILAHGRIAEELDARGVDERSISELYERHQGEP